MNSLDTLENLHNINDESSTPIKREIGRLIFRVTLWFLIGFSFFSFFFVASFPYTSMRISFNIGLERASLFHSERVVNRHIGRDGYNEYNSRFMDALFLSNSLSGHFLIDYINNGDTTSRNAIRMAERVKNATNLMLNDNYKTSVNYRIQNVVNPARLDSVLSRAHMPPVYSYKTSILQNQMRANFVLDDTAYFTNHARESIFAPINASHMTTITYILIQFSALLESELSVIGYCYIREHYYASDIDINQRLLAIVLNIDATNRFSSLVTGNNLSPNLLTLQSYICYLKAFIADFNPTTEQESLMRTWWALNLALLSDTVNSVLLVLLAHNPSPILLQAHYAWTTIHNRTQVGGSSVPLWWWYQFYILPSFVLFAA